VNLISIRVDALMQHGPDEDTTVKLVATDCQRKVRTVISSIFKNRSKSLILLGERGGARTHDPVIKSHVLYRLSYALARGAV
jgi:hypothetical protein